MTEAKKYLTYEGLQEYHNGMKDHITEVVENQPSPLPSVTTNDAGKFLRVSSTGLWVAETIPSAEEAMF